MAGYGQGAAEGLEDVLARLFLQQKQRQLVAQQQAELAESQRQADQRNVISQGQLRQGDERIGLDRSELSQRDKHFQTESGFKDRGLKLEETAAPIRGRLMSAQAADIERKPDAERQERDFVTGRDKTLHGYRIGEIGAQGEQSARVAGIRQRSRISKVPGVNAQGQAVTKFVDLDTQEVVHEELAAPTAEQRNKEAASGRAAPVLGAISELSERINTQQGVVAKISGAFERAKAQANLNDDITEYESVVSGFTPMLARAVGHTGVLTEQDVQSVRKMLPQPGDSKSVRDRKIARINSLMSAVSGPSASGSGEGAAQGGGRTYYDANGNPVKR